MASELLATKLYAPRPRPGLVSRPRLLALLERGARSRLTVISAPPGFGKSTLLADWLGSSAMPRRSAAWVSLDPGDNDAAWFWAYVIASFETASPGSGTAARATLESSNAPIDSVLTALLNALGEVKGDVVLVLDDYHVIERPEIHDGVAFLVDHLPAHVHVILATRADPALSLARLRARGDLVEIRAADLRFTGHEAEAYLNGPMGLALTSRVAALEGRTEGWIAALQLAALSIGGRDDAAAFIRDFAGDDRYIVDYLIEEVLERQSESIRRFLLETSILERLTGPLCDAVTGTSDSQATLEALERANLFVIALDDRRSWYRYHHLFADVLRARLWTEGPDLIPMLHGRASRWFGSQGDEAGAIEHALAADDVARAADLIELAAAGMRARRQETTLRRWLDALPDETFETRPLLAIAHAGALLSTGEPAGAERRLTEAERWIPATHGDSERADAEAAGMVVRDTDLLAHLPSALALYRSALAHMRGDADASIASARAAFEAAGPDRPLERGGAAGMLALAHWGRGDLDDAHAAWSESAANLELAGHRADILGVSVALADIRIAQGRLDDARRTYERGLRIGEGLGGTALRGTVDMQVGLADVHLERNDLAAAKRDLDAATELGEALGLPQNPYRQRVVAARLCVAEGDFDAAIELLDEAERRYDGDFFPNVRPVAAVRARVRLSQGRQADARDWAQGVDVSADDDLTYMREYEHATLARLLLAEGIRDRADDTILSAIELAERLVAAADAGGRNGSVIDVLVVLALARSASADRQAAAVALDRATALAEPEGYARVFLDEGAPMTALLTSAADRRGASAYLRDLLAATGSTRAAPTGRQPLIEPLSERELEVLRLLDSDLDGPEVARELSISLNTLRTHTRNVYAKLGVNSRRAAVRRAVDLGILPQTGGRTGAA